MKIKHLTIVAACCVLMLTGCKDNKPQYGAPLNVRIYGVTGKPDLEPGLKIGLYVSEPVGADNFLLRVTESGSVVSDRDLKWAFDQSQSLRFFAYAPYDQSFTGKEFVTIKTPTDQRREDWMLKGNLLTGVASGGPKDTYVTMKLKHAMTAMTVSFDNRSGKRIDALSVRGIMTVGSLDLITGNLKAVDSLKPIQPMRSPYDENTFTFIYIPQDATPIFDVTLSSGKTIAFTFDNYCHEYPGSVIKMNIQIDESTPKVNILKLGGVTISQWASNGVPIASATSPYINLADLKYVEPDESEDGFFAAYINKVTVTAIDRTNDEIMGAILEDSTRAVHVWTYYDSPLKVGSTIVGPIMGLMDKPSDDEFNISFFYTNYATIGKTRSLPCTEGSFGDLAKKIDKWEYRRMLFKDVKLKESFKEDRAVFVQDSNLVSVVCPGIDVALAKGVSGDLIGFPVRSGSDITLMVYDIDQFDSFTKDYTDNVFTKDSICGLYDVTDPDTAVYLMTGADMDLQYSVRRYDFGRTMQVTDTHNGEAHLFLIFDRSGSPIVGHEYMVYFNTMGKSEMKGTNLLMECVKVNDNKAWLIDKSGKFGLVLAL